MVQVDRMRKLPRSVGSGFQMARLRVVELLGQLRLIAVTASDYYMHVLRT